MNKESVTIRCNDEGIPCSVKDFMRKNYILVCPDSSEKFINIDNLTIQLQTEAGLYLKNKEPWTYPYDRIIAQFPNDVNIEVRYTIDGRGQSAKEFGNISEKVLQVDPTSESKSIFSATVMAKYQQKVTETAVEKAKRENQEAQNDAKEATAKARAALKALNEAEKAEEEARVQKESQADRLNPPTPEEKARRAEVEAEAAQDKADKLAKEEKLESEKAAAIAKEAKIKTDKAKIDAHAKSRKVREEDGKSREHRSRQEQKKYADAARKAADEYAEAKSVADRKKTLADARDEVVVAESKAKSAREKAEVAGVKAIDASNELERFLRNTKVKDHTKHAANKAVTNEIKAADLNSLETNSVWLYLSTLVPGKGLLSWVHHRIAERKYQSVTIRVEDIRKKERDDLEKVEEDARSNKTMHDSANNQAEDARRKAHEKAQAAEAEAEANNPQPPPWSSFDPGPASQNSPNN